MTSTPTFRIRNGNLIEEDHLAADPTARAWSYAVAYVGVTSGTKSIVVERVERYVDGEPEDVTAVCEISTGKMNTGSIEHLLYRSAGEQRWHARCRSVTRHGKGMPYIFQTSGQATCRNCLDGIGAIGEAPATARADIETGESTVRVGDIREGTGTHHVRVRVDSIEGGDVNCTLVRSGGRKTISLRTLRSAYRLVERGAA